MELLNPPVLVRASELFDEPVRARLLWQNESDALVLHSLPLLFWLPAVLLPLLFPELSQQLWQQSPERARLEEVNVELTEAVSVKLEESKVQMYPGPVQNRQAQVKMRTPLLPLVVKKSQLQVEYPGIPDEYQSSQFRSLS